jgi:hypothetical protein
MTLGIKILLCVCAHVALAFLLYGFRAKNALALLGYDLFTFGFPLLLAISTHACLLFYYKIFFVIYAASAHNYNNIIIDYHRGHFSDYSNGTRGQYLWFLKMPFDPKSIFFQVNLHSQP